MMPPLYLRWHRSNCMPGLLEVDSVGVPFRSDYHWDRVWLHFGRRTGHKYRKFGQISNLRNLCIPMNSRSRMSASLSG